MSIEGSGAGASRPSSFPVLDWPGYPLPLAVPAVMGVLNVTPDSFSDGARYGDPAAAVARAAAMLEEGAAIIDVGGESTRPGATPVPVQQELDRVLPVIEALRARFECRLSIDTRRPEVMQAACAAGAGLINDINALRAPGALEAAARSGAAVCLMHMQGEPATMQVAPRYDDVVAEVEAFLRERVAAAEAAGLPRNRLLIDPGFGFGKSFAHNAALLQALPRLTVLGVPILVGFSRKRMLGELSGLPVERRLGPGIAAAALAVWSGASLVRTHDVADTVAALRFVAAIRSDAA